MCSNRKAFNSTSTSDPKTAVTSDGEHASNAITNIRIPGVSCFAITKVIEYSYLRTCDLTEKNVYEILVVADYVAMIGLVQMCVQFLTKSLNPTNCIGIMRFSM